MGTIGYFRNVIVVALCATGLACGDDEGVGGSGTDSGSTATEGSASDGGTAGPGGTDSGASDTASGGTGGTEDTAEVTGDPSGGPGGMTSAGTGGTDGSTSASTTVGVSESDTNESASDTNESDSDSGESDSDSGESDSDTGESDSDSGESDSDTGESDSDTGESDSDTGESDSDTGESDSDTDTGESDTDGTTGDGCDDVDPINLVVNGSFEEPVVMQPANWDIYTSDETPGWDVTWGGLGACEPDDPVQEPVIEIQQNLHAIAVDGIQYAELDTDCQGPVHNANTDEKTSVRVWQMIDTSSSDLFEVRFYARERPNVGGAQLLTATFGGQVLIDAVVATPNWKEYVFQVSVDADTSVLDLVDVGQPDSLGVFIDDVRVYAIDHGCL